MLCYKCSQRKVVVDAKVRSRFGANHNSASREFEAYLYQQSPLCDKCTKVLLSNESRDTARDIDTHSRSSSLTFMAKIVLLFLTLNLMGILIFSLSAGTPNVSMATLFNKSSTVLHDLRRVAGNSLGHVQTLLHSLLKGDFRQIETWTFPSSFDDRLYVIILVIQITTVALRQQDVSSMALSLLSYLICRSHHHILSSVSIEGWHLDALRYLLLVLSVLRVFTKKSTVVTISKRKNVQRPVIKVRRSPKKRDSASAGTLFSDDEDSQHPPRKPVLETAAPSTNEKPGAESRDQPLAIHKAEHSTPIPLKDVSSRFNIMNISGSPVKTASETKEKERQHRSCLRPAKFSLQDSSLAASLSASSERLRFDSTETEHNIDNSAEIPEMPTIKNEALQLKPIILVLLLSVLMNYYFIVNYVLSSAPVET